MKKTLFLLSLFACLGITSCSSYNLVKVKNITDKPSKRSTIFSESLSCLGNMANYYGKSIKIITVGSVHDRTGISEADDKEIPSDMTDIVITELTKVAGPVRINYVPTSEETNRLAALGFLKSRYIPTGPDKSYKDKTIILQGALTEYDRIIGNDKFNRSVGSKFGSGRGETDIDYSNDLVRTIGRMTMDFRIVQASVGEIENASSSSNTLEIEQNAKTKAFSIGIYGNTLSRNISVSEIDARHAALRVLIQLGIIETLGKHWKLPYWKCSDITPEKKEMNFIKTVVVNSIKSPEVLDLKSQMTTLGTIKSHPTIDYSFLKSTLSSLEKDSKGATTSKKFHSAGTALSKFPPRDQRTKALGLEECAKLKKKSNISPNKANCVTQATKIASHKSKFYDLYKLYRRSSAEKKRLKVKWLTKDNTLTDLVGEMKDIHQERLGRPFPLKKSYASIPELYADFWINAPFDPREGK